MDSVRAWFKKAEIWQKDMFCQLWGGQTDTKIILDRAIKLSRKQYFSEDCKLIPLTDFPEDIPLSGNESCQVLLNKISDVQGVGVIAATQPLAFSSNLTVVYGENGCGKSSYVRIIKSAHSPSYSGSIFGNVYSSTNPPPQANLTFSEDGIDSSITWTPSLEKACPIHIYDSSTAQQFVENENEVVYEPQILSVISKMAEIYSNLANYYSELRESTSLSQTPALRHDAKLLPKLHKITTVKEFEKFIASIQWSESEQLELSAALESLLDNNPSATRKSYEQQRSAISKHLSLIVDTLNKLNDAFIEDYLSKRAAQITTKKTEDEIILRSQQSSLLTGLGSDCWTTMWDSAFKFAESICGSAKHENDIAVDNRCVLCQQHLDEASIKRAKVLRAFRYSDAKVKAEQAFNEFKRTVEYIQHINDHSLSLQKIDEELQAYNVSDDIRDIIVSIYSEIKSRCLWLLEYEDDSTPCPSLLSSLEVQKKLQPFIEDLSTRISALEQVIKNRDTIEDRIDYLLESQWINDNANQKRNLIHIQLAEKTCKTNALTTLKKDLTDILITDAYVSRFHDEMIRIDPSHNIRVELVSKGAKRGRAYHQVALKGMVQNTKKRKIGDVLSEGEFRVVSLAAFLTDMNTWGRNLPFVFDDPITSLDHIYEGRVASRLAALSSERQVIVFTHRLAFAQLLELSVKNFNKEQVSAGSGISTKITHIQLRRDPLGQPSTPTYTSQFDMIKALNTLKQNDIPAIRQLHEDENYRVHDMYMLRLCSDIRNIVEEGIERTLLGGIVNRFDLPVYSQKIRYLRVINISDIDLFDNMMSKYSQYDHSQPIESPLVFPSLSEIESDIDDLLSCANDLKNRRKKVDK